MVWMPCISGPWLGPDVVFRSDTPRQWSGQPTGRTQAACTGRCRVFGRENRPEEPQVTCPLPATVPARAAGPKGGKGDLPLTQGVGPSQDVHLPI